MDIKPKISVIIPYYKSDEGKDAILKRWIDSLPPEYTEVIISGNVKEGYAIPINRGLAIARGDFMLVSNDDLIFDTGSLYDLCKPGAVTSPKINGQKQDFWGCCFMIPREIYEKVGGLDEGFRISYYEDDAYEFTLRKNEIKIRGIGSVNIQHPEGGRTLHTFTDHNEFSEENKKRFVSIWGYEPPVIREFYNLNKRLPEKGEISV